MRVYLSAACCYFCHHCCCRCCALLPSLMLLATRCQRTERYTFNCNKPELLSSTFLTRSTFLTMHVASKTVTMLVLNQAARIRVIDFIVGSSSSRKQAAAAAAAAAATASSITSCQHSQQCSYQCTAAYLSGAASAQLAASAVRLVHCCRSSARSSRRTTWPQPGHW